MAMRQETVMAMRWARPTDNQDKSSAGLHVPGRSTTVLHVVGVRTVPYVARTCSNVPQATAGGALAEARGRRRVGSWAKRLAVSLRE